MSDPLINLVDSVSWLHSKRRGQVYVILSHDGSTIMQDPGLDRPWSSPNQKIAEHHARITTKQGYKCHAVLLTPELVAKITAHPKNRPTGKS